MTDLDSQPTLPGRFKWGRIVSLAGAAGLCVSFFMPQIAVRGPGSLVEAMVENGGMFLVAIGLPFLAAILLLPLLAFRAVPRVDGVAGVGKFLAWAVCAICLAVLITGLGGIALAFVHNGFRSDVPFVHGAIMCLSLVLAIIAMVRSRLPRKAAAAQFALGVCCLAYFAFFTTVDTTVYAGLWLSLAASGALTIGSAIDWFQCCPARKGTHDDRP
jgi:lysylphosphatidylglycerol synthetase-like protein (DUF2156 family)